MLNDALQRVEQMLSWLPPFGCIFDEKTIVIQREDELAELLRVLSELGVQQPRAILECGYYRGGTSLIWRALYPDAHIIAIDLRDPHQHFNEQDLEIFRTLARGKFTYICGSCYNPVAVYVVQKALEVSGEREIDFAFFDAEKDYINAIMLFEHLFSPQVVFACHDLCWEQAHAGNISVCYASLFSKLSPYLARSGVVVRTISGEWGYAVFANINPCKELHISYKTDERAPVKVFSSVPSVRRAFGIDGDDILACAIVDKTILGDDIALWDVSWKIAGLDSSKHKIEHLLIYYSYAISAPHYTEGSEYFVITGGGDLSDFDWMWLQSHMFSPRCRGVLVLEQSRWDFLLWLIGWKVASAPVNCIPLRGFNNHKLLTLGAPENIDGRLLALLSSVAHVVFSPCDVGVAEFGRVKRITVNSPEGNVVVVTDMSALNTVAHAAARVFVLTNEMFMLSDLDWFPPAHVRARKGIVISDWEISIPNTEWFTHVEVLSATDDVLRNFRWGVVLCSSGGDCAAAARLSRLGIPYITNNWLVGALYPLASYVESHTIVDYAHMLASDSGAQDNFVISSFAPQRSFYRITPLAFADLLVNAGMVNL